MKPCRAETMDGAERLLAVRLKRKGGESRPLSVPMKACSVRNWGIKAQLGLDPKDKSVDWARKVSH
jgi:hypothetical protein